MRAVIDTNVLVSGLLWGGPPRHVVQQALEGRFTWLMSEALLDELADVLARPRFEARFNAAGQTLQEVLEIIRRRALIIPVDVVNPVIEADPDDDLVLACALAGRVDVIVSGDHHLLELGSYRGIPVLTATALLEQLEDRE